MLDARHPTSKTPRPWASSPLPAHEAVLACAAARPDATAVVSVDGRLTYGELVNRASRLSNRLDAIGIGCERFVGVATTRSTNLPVALLGTLLTGAAYVPIDLAYPAERVRFMVEDAGIDAVVTDTPLPPWLDKDTPTVVRLDVDGPLDACPAVPRSRPVPLEAAAYVVYTSGSTGTPKGVVIEHRNLAAFLAWAHDAFPPSHHDMVAAVTSACFDLSVYELLAPLTTGGTVIVLRDTLHLAEAELPASASLLNAVPSAVEALVRVGRVPSGVRAVNLAGEPLPAKLLNDLLALPGVERVANLYGPSETTVYSTAAFFERPHPEDQPPCIGEPVTGTQAWVLDSAGEVVPPGVAGELYLGGDGVGRGYLRRPGLTADRFVPDVLSGEPGRRLYRTGDIVRRRRDGGLDFLGRVDNQVKVRGFRIELAEVEVALLAHPAVREAVVVVVGANAADRALHALVVTDGRAIEGSELREFLAVRLPAFEVPERFTVTDALPRTPNGKVDRNAAVSVATAAAPAATLSASAPVRSPGEERLAGVWAALLGVDANAIVPDDDFFALGGQSLLAMQLVAAVADTLRVELRLAQVFETRTLSAMAACIDSGRPPTRRPLIASGATHGPLAPTQEAFVDAWEPTAAPSVAPVYRVTGPIDIPALERALGEVVRRHEVLRTVYRSRLGRQRQVVLPWTPTSIRVVDATAKGRTQLDPRQVIADHIVAPFDLADGPPLRALLVKLASRDHLFCLAVNEIACDGLSMTLFLGELGALYESLVTGVAARLPHLPVQYLDYARRQCEVVRRRGRAQRTYWVRQLRDAPVAVDLLPDQWPTSFSRVEARSVELCLDPDLVAAVKRLRSASGTTLFTITAAAFQAAVGAATSRRDVVLRCTFSDQSLPEVAPLIGFFVNFLLLRTDLSDDPTFRELMGSVARATTEATANVDIPFSEVRNRVGRMRTGRHRLPVGDLRFQVVSHVALPEFRLAGLRVDQVRQPVAPSDHFALGCLERADGSLVLYLNYDANLFSSDGVDRFLSRYCRLLRRAVNEPDHPLSTLTAPDRREAEPARRLSTPERRPEAEATVPALVARTAARRGDAIAVVTSDTTVTYDELVGRVAAATAALRAHGMEGRAVGVAVEHSVDFVVGLLAVLTAGAVAVPFDLSRREAPAMLRKAGVAAVTRRVHRLDVPAIDLEAPAGVDAPSLVADKVDSREWAMAIPVDGARAAVHSHAALCQAVTWFTRAHRLRATDAVAALRLRPGRIVGAVLAPLTVGATCVFDPAGSHASVVVAECDGLVPVSDRLRLVVMEEPASHPPGRGAPTVMEHVARPEVGGPWLTARATTSPCIVGRPVPGVGLHVLGPDFRPVPPDVPGELCLHGPALADAYLGDPQATAETFVPDPVCGEPGCRLLRTGLMGRLYGRDGVELLGAAEDWEVRGRPTATYLRTVEACVRTHAAVASVIAGLTSVLGEERVMVAVVARSGGRLQARDLRRLLPEGLPKWAMPIRIEIVPRWPRSADGRIDYAAVTGRRTRKRR